MFNALACSQAVWMCPVNPWCVGTHFEQNQHQINLLLIVRMAGIGVYVFVNR